MRKITQSTTAPQLFSRAKANNKIRISNAEFMRVYRQVVDKACKAILDGEKFSMPSLGFISISSVSTTKKLVDWGSTSTMWKTHPDTKERSQVVYFLNEHIIYYYRWHKNIAGGFFAKNIYRIRPCISWRRSLKQAIESGKEYL